MESPDWVRVSLTAPSVDGTTEPMRRADARKWIETMQLIFPRALYEIMPCEPDWAEPVEHPVPDGHSLVTH